ncbi:MAG: YegS/Rv2252/BmrU family lipid kinase [Flavobacteriaceae bacterium]|nr:YegS/Rv2252/BmrU family lipid kinase [Flavobacteriaceae bacterium]
MQRKSITFIIHGKLKSSSALKSRVNSLFKTHYTIQFKITDKETGAKNCTIDAIKEESDIIVICGGDGSVNEMVNGFFSTNNYNHPSFAILPMGTGNDFAKSLGANNDLEELKKTIDNQNTIDVSIFKMNYINKNQKPKERYFINVSDIGIGGLVAENVSKSSKILGSNIIYIKAIISSFLKYKKQPITLTSDSFKWSGYVLSLCMANGKYFGSGICIAPDADIADDKLQLTILGNISLLDYLKNISKSKKGKKIIHKEVIYTNVLNCEIVSNREPCPIDMDGEFIGYTPVKVRKVDIKMKFYTNF